MFRYSQNLYVCFSIATVLASGQSFGQDNSPSLEPTFVGKSIAQGKLRNQVMQLYAPQVQLLAGCSAPIDQIETSIVDVPKQPTFNQARMAVSGEVREQWIASLCSKKQTMFVTYSFTPEGKTNYAVSGSLPRSGMLESLPKVQ